MDYMTTYDVAKRLGVSRQTVLKWAKEGVIPIAEFSCSGRHLYDADCIEEIASKVDFHKLITASEAARVLGVAYTTVLAYKDKGYIKNITEFPAGRFFFDKEEIDQLDKACGMPYSDDLYTSGDIARGVGIDTSQVCEMLKTSDIKPARVLPSGKVYYTSDVYMKFARAFKRVV